MHPALRPENVLASLLALTQKRVPTAAQRRATVAKTMATKKRKQKERQAAALARREAARPEVVRNPPPGYRIQDELLLVMEPGEWYGANDITRAAGLPKHAEAKLRQVLLKNGLVEMAVNPDPQRYDARGMVIGPKYLFALTPKGEEGKQLAALARQALASVEGSEKD